MPLYIASCKGHTEEVGRLLQAGADVNQVQKDGSTPLTIACERGRTDVVKMLLAHDGVDVNQANKNGWTPLNIANHNGHAEVVKMLLAHDGVDVNQATVSYTHLTLPTKA